MSMGSNLGGVNVGGINADVNVHGEQGVNEIKRFQAAVAALETKMDELERQFSSTGDRALTSSNVASNRSANPTPG